MKKIWIVAVLGVLMSCAGEQNEGSNPIVGKWAMAKVIDGKTGNLARDQVYKGIVYTFNADGTARFQQSGDYGNKDFGGEWVQVGDTIKLEYEGTKSAVLITKLTEDELVWSVPGSDKWRFYFQKSRK